MTTKSSFHNRFKTNRAAETEGVWLDFGEGLKVKVRYMECDRVRAAQNKLFKMNRQALSAGGGVLPPAVQDTVDVQLLARDVIVDWKGVTDEEGKEQPFTTKNAIDVLTDLREFRKEIQYLAGLAETFREAGFAEQLGNSKESTTPSSDTETKKSS